MKLKLLAILALSSLPVAAVAMPVVGDMIGTDPDTAKAALESTVERLKADGTHRWSLQVAGLEEAFIYLMAGARDNFSRDGQKDAA